MNLCKQKQKSTIDISFNIDSLRKHQKTVKSKVTSKLRELSMMEDHFGSKYGTACSYSPLKLLLIIDDTMI